MVEDAHNYESFNERIQQLEHERDELHKDIEQLCMQQAGPSYLAVATRMHFQRTAGLEQEIGNLKKALAACTRDKLNLQEELSEAYHIKGQLADLHSEEVLKNLEAENQIKFFQGCVAAAFSERDQSLMEAEKAREKEEVLSQNLSDLQERVEVLTGNCLVEKKIRTSLQSELVKQEEQNENFKKVVDKFYRIRQHYIKGYDYEGPGCDDICARLLHDSDDRWSFNDRGEASTSGHISALEEELEILRNSVKNLNFKLRVGLDIESHLKRRVSELESRQILIEDLINSGISGLLHSHSQCRVHIKKLLDDGLSEIKATINIVEEKITQYNVSRLQNLELSQRGTKLDENECGDVYISPDAVANFSAKKHGLGSSTTMAGRMSSTPEALALALKEKVATLLLLSQQEERHLLEKDVKEALQRKVEELQRNLIQVTNEKVTALMELAQLKLEHQLLHEKFGDEIKERKVLTGTSDSRICTRESDGKLKGLLKKTYLGRWVSTVDFSRSENEGALDVARMKIENATFKESNECMEHLCSTIQRLRLSLLQAKESVASDSPSKTLEHIIYEAQLMKTALGSSLPVSWQAEGASRTFGEKDAGEPVDVSANGSQKKLDSVSAAGFEMVELILFAAHMLKDCRRDFLDVS